MGNIWSRRVFALLKHPLPQRIHHQCSHKDSNLLLNWFTSVVRTSGHCSHQAGAAGLFYIVSLQNKCRQRAPTDLDKVLICTLITGIVLGLSGEKGELICLFRSSKHLWVADKNTQETMKPHIPLLAQDQVSFGLRFHAAPLFCFPLICHCCLSQAFLFQPLQSRKRNTSISSR